MTAPFCAECGNPGPVTYKNVFCNEECHKKYRRKKKLRVEDYPGFYFQIYCEHCMKPFTLKEWLIKVKNYPENVSKSDFQPFEYGTLYRHFSKIKVWPPHQIFVTGGQQTYTARCAYCDNNIVLLASEAVKYEHYFCTKLCKMMFAKVKHKRGNRDGLARYRYDRRRENR